MAETLQQSMARLLRDAHAAADNGDLDGAAETASAALDDWRQEQGITAVFDHEAASRLTQLQSGLKEEIERLQDEAQRWNVRWDGADRAGRAEIASKQTELRNQADRLQAILDRSSDD